MNPEATILIETIIPDTGNLGEIRNGGGEERAAPS